MHVITLLLITLFTIAGCSGYSRLQPPQPPADDATVKIAEAAASVSASLVEIARIESANTPSPGRRLVSADTPGMSDLVSVDWSGPIDQLVEKLARASGYRLRVLGKPPAIPVLVSVTANNLPLSAVLRDLDFQASKKARIIAFPNPDPRKRVIELRYAYS